MACECCQKLCQAERLHKHSCCRLSKAANAGVSTPVGVAIHMRRMTADEVKEASKRTATAANRLATNAPMTFPDSVTNIASVTLSQSSDLVEAPWGL